MGKKSKFLSHCLSCAPPRRCVGYTRHAHTSGRGHGHGLEHEVIGFLLLLRQPCVRLSVMTTYLIQVSLFYKCSLLTHHHAFHNTSGAQGVKTEGQYQRHQGNDALQYVKDHGPFLLLELCQRYTMMALTQDFWTTLWAMHKFKVTKSRTNEYAPRHVRMHEL